MGREPPSDQLAALLEEDEEERLAEEAMWEHQHHGDAERRVF